MKVEAPYRARTPSRQIVFAAAAIFLVGFGVRVLSWHDTRRDVGKVQSVVVGDYQRTARLLRQHGVVGFFSRSGPLADPDLLGHPPGYPILLAIVTAVFGESNTAVQFVQIVCDALAAVLIFLIAIELLPISVGVIAGILVAVAPQFAWNSVLLLPDSLAVFPILLAVYLLTRALKRPHWMPVLIAGVLIGLSCWLRANALLLAPFLGFVVFVLFDRQQRLRYAATLLAGTVLYIAPLTIRNLIVHDSFVPVSLGAGQTMLEGIADYDPLGRFGIPETDMGIMKMEAEQYNRPDYYATLFSPDGVKRDRMRLARSFGIIAHHPIWFAGVILQRAGSMLRLERARAVSTRPSVTHSLERFEQSPKVWQGGTDFLSQPAEKAAQSQVSLDEMGMVRIVSDNSKQGNQITSRPISVTERRDFVFRFLVRVQEGRMAVNIIGAQSGQLLASSIIEKAEVKDGQSLPLTVVEIPFVSGSEGSVALMFANAAPHTGKSIVEVGAMSLYDLGPSGVFWSRPLRLLLWPLQKLFITAVMLPLALFGIVMLVRSRACQTLILLLAVPAYYLSVQSWVHTEYRYVLAVHYFLFVMVAVSLYRIAGLLRPVFSRLR
jgi:hypothetical protein